MSVKTYFPIMLNLHGRRCVVVGGGTVAERKIAALLECGAQVTVVSPACTDRIGQLIGSGLIRGLSREYRPGDAAGAFMVIAAANDEAVNAEVGEDAIRWALCSTGRIGRRPATRSCRLPCAEES